MNDSTINSGLNGPRRHVAWSLILVCLFSMSALAVAGPASGQIDQLQEMVIYVDQKHPAASDSNPGTDPSAPLKTISEGLARAETARQGQTAATVQVAGGTYREALTIQGNGPTEPQPLLQLIGNGAVRVSGSDIWQTGWKKVRPRIFRHKWPYNWGNTPIPEGWKFVKPFLDTPDGRLIQRREMVFVNGKLLRQVLRKKELNAKRGAFWVSQRKDALLVRFPGRTSPRRDKVEISTRPLLLEMRDTNNVHISNFVFQHANSTIDQEAVNVVDAAEVDIVDSTFRWNNWFALWATDTSDINLQRSAFNHNGAGGLGGQRIRDLTVSNVKASFNNWRGWWAHFTVWAVGQKFHQMTNAVFTNYTATRNKSHGLWIDFGNANVTIERSSFRNNYGHGVFFDSNQGPLALRNSKSCGNRNGIFAHSSRDVTVDNNVLYNNEVFGIYVSGPFKEATRVRDAAGNEMPVISERWTLHDNLIVNRWPSQFLFGTPLSTERWNDFKQTFNSDDNLWYNPGRERPFQIARGYGESYSRPLVDFSRWRKETGEGPGSRYKQPARFRNLCS